MQIARLIEDERSGAWESTTPDRIAGGPISAPREFSCSAEFAAPDQRGAGLAAGHGDEAGGCCAAEGAFIGSAASAAGGFGFAAVFGFFFAGGFEADGGGGAIRRTGGASVSST